MGIGFTEKPITGWDGLALFGAFFEKLISGLNNWRSFGEGLEASELRYAMYPDTERRIAAIRESVKERPEARGRKLFDIEDYKYHAVVTNRVEPPEDVWRFYNKRADIENRIKELKYDFNAENFCQRSFWGTATVFQLICLLFNLIQTFRVEVLKNPASKLETLRYQHFVIGSHLSSSGRRLLLLLGLLTDKTREAFSALMERVSGLSSTVTQSTLPAPSAWHRPPPPRRKRRRPAPS